MRTLGYVLVVMALAGCDTMQRDTDRVIRTVAEHYDDTRKRVASYIYEEPETESVQEVVMTPRFCYQHLMDVVCYTQPQQHLYRTLIGVQGQHGYAYRDFVPEEVAAFQPGEEEITSDILEPVDSYTPQSLIIQQ